MYRIATLLISFLMLNCIVMQAQNSKTKYADKFFTTFNFEAAAQNYESLLDKKDIDKTYLYTRLGDSYRLMNNTIDAEKWYAKAVNSESVASQTVYHYAQMLRSNSKYSAAEEVFAKYQSLQNDGEVNNIIEGLNNVEQLLTPNEFLEVKITPINTKQSDFAPFIFQNDMYFASNGRPSVTDKQDLWTQEPFLQMFKVDVSGYDQFGTVILVEDKKMNGTYHDGPVFVDPITKDLYITRNNYVNKKFTKDEEKNVNLKIMRKSQNENGDWSGSEMIDDFPFNSDDYSVGHVSISPDGTTMYFASDMPHSDAMGGVDLYSCTRNGDTWGDLKNLGPKINTMGHERFPFIHSEGHLFFASDGHPGLGGMDLYEAMPDGKESWGSVLNMGAPLNTNYDDFALVLKDKVREGYFTSNRPSAFGDDDIYSFKDLGIKLIGVVVDAKTGAPICNSGVEMLLGMSDKGNMNTECDGRFQFSVEVGKEYSFEACAKEYFCNKTITASTKGLKPGSVVEVEIPLKQEAKFDITVIVIDKETKAPITTSRVNFYDGCGGQKYFKQSDAAGSSQYNGQSDCEYTIGAMAKSYFPKDTILSTEGITEDVEVVIELSKEGMYDVTDAGEDGIVFYHIYYDFDESYIRGDADPDLQIVLDFMLENPTAIVQIESHTDARAPYQYNIDLSKRRADAAKAWLQSKGIDAARLQTIGFGEIRPVNGCIDNIKCTEKEHQLNRRTEFRIVGGNVDTKSLARFNIKVDPCNNCPF
jgi:outer membrane protein OmpA-like peptidoglycan-associated protein